ncbi:MAG: enolase C-terminal domain-like protein [Cypionkella sp.]
MPLAMDENPHAIHEFEYTFQQANLKFIQPNGSNCGDIRGWLQVADLSVLYGSQVCSHGMQEQCVILVAGRRLDRGAFFPHRPLYHHTIHLMPDDLSLRNAALI